jgi:hypothetical protein
MILLAHMPTTFEWGCPGPYEEVNIDLQAVVIGNTQMVQLNTTAVFIKTNGVSTLIATSELSDAKVSQISWYLSKKHSGCGGITYQLAHQVQNNQVWNYKWTKPCLPIFKMKSWFDFDAIIVETGSGTLQPSSG